MTGSAERSIQAAGCTVELWEVTLPGHDVDEVPIGNVPPQGMHIRVRADSRLSKPQDVAIALLAGIAKYGKAASQEYVPDPERFTPAEDDVVLYIPYLPELVCNVQTRFPRAAQPDELEGDARKDFLDTIELMARHIRPRAASPSANGRA